MRTALQHQSSVIMGGHDFGSGGNCPNEMSLPYAVWFGGSYEHSLLLFAGVHRGRLEAGELVHFVSVRRRFRSEVDHTLGPLLAPCCNGPARRCQSRGQRLTSSTHKCRTMFNPKHVLRIVSSGRPLSKYFHSPCFGTQRRYVVGLLSLTHTDCS